MRIAITGASGYIGQRLIRAAQSEGYEVVALSRTLVGGSNVEWCHYDLASVEPLKLPHDISVVFHLAADTRKEQVDEQIELLAARRLIAAAKSIHADFVFVSSQAACPDAPSAYGRIKWKIERDILAAGGSVVRPGQVYGGPERGLFGLLCALVGRLPVLPSFLPSPVVQPIHVDDLARALLACSTQPASSVICLAAPEGIRFVTFLQAIAWARRGKQRLHIPVPTALVHWLAVALGSSLRNKCGLDRVESLFLLPKMDTGYDLQRLGLKLRPLSAGMTRSGSGRRELLSEGRVLLRYVLGMTPDFSLMRRYVRAIEMLKEGKALPLPNVVVRYPILLPLLDGASGLDMTLRSDLDWRLNASLMLAEASPQGAARFLGSGREMSAVWCCLLMTWAVLKEVCRRTAQLLFWPFLAKLGRRVKFDD